LTSDTAKLAGEVLVATNTGAKIASSLTSSSLSDSSAIHFPLDTFTADTTTLAGVVLVATKAGAKIASDTLTVDLITTVPSAMTIEVDALGGVLRFLPLFLLK
jgi:hypothetical protein